MNVPCFVERCKAGAVPQRYIEGASDEQIAMWGDIAVGLINYVNPVTTYRIHTAPENWDAAVFYGMTALLAQIQMANYSINDFNYNDNGISMSLDRTSKIASVNQAVREQFNNMAFNLKKYYGAGIGPIGLGYPRYQAQMSPFLRIMYGAGYTR